MTESAITLEGVSKRFGDVRAVIDLSLTVQRGEVFGFLGPNGAGKTTTIRMITGLTRPDTGRVQLFGYDIEKDYIPARRQFAYIPDEGFLYPRMTGREFLAFLWVAHHQTSPDRRKIDEVLEMMGLSLWGDTLIEQYSHGMRQRLLFAAALMRDVPLWIVDEPIIGLDPAAVRMVKRLFRAKADRGETVFMSTHLLELAEAVCDRVAIIHRGRLIAVGDLASIRRGQGGEPAALEEAFLRMTEDAARDRISH